MYRTEVNAAIDLPAITNAAMAMMKKEHMLRLHSNVQMAKCYAATICLMVGFFVVAHFLRQLRVKRSESSAVFPLPQLLISMERKLRGVLLSKVPGFSSMGHILLFTFYGAINLALTLSSLEMTRVAFGARFGWMAALNLALVIFLGLKNTPLAVLTSYSYERLNCLHRLAGYMTVVYLVMHAATHCVNMMEDNHLYKFKEPWMVAGLLVGLSMIVSTAAATFVRPFNYEIFYVIHVLLVPVMIISLGFHRPKFDAQKVAYLTVFIGVTWTLDRLVRLGRIALNGINNSVTLHPLPKGGTRIILHKPILFAKPAQHAFLWIPGVRCFETHPFTMVSNSPAEFIVKARNGFTRSLHDLAIKNDGRKLRASVDGCYGKMPNPLHFDKTVIFVGGSGASFGFGMVSQFLQARTTESKANVELVWVLRHIEHIIWYLPHLQILRSHQEVTVRLFLTGPPPSPRYQGLLSLPPEVWVEQMAPYGPVTPSARTEEEKIAEARRAVETLNDFRYTLGRPDVDRILRHTERLLDRDGTLFVAGCGPGRMLKDVRNSVARRLRGGEPSVTLHCEQFGW